MLDSQAIAESNQKLLLSFHEVNLKEMFANGITSFQFQGLMKPSDLLCDRFFLNEDRPEIPVCGEGRDRRFVKLTVVFPDPEKHVADGGRVDFLIDFECVHCGYGLRGFNTA